MQVKLSQFLSGINCKLVVIDMPHWKETIGLNVTDKPRMLTSDSKNYSYLDPKKSLKKFQNNY